MIAMVIAVAAVCLFLFATWIGEDNYRLRTGMVKAEKQLPPPVTEQESVDWKLYELLKDEDPHWLEDVGIEPPPPVKSRLIR